ncbi:MAG TPA: acyl-CoA dehydrogenase family protein [Actinomycetota bacterium]|nr:acyl-CoA dehydrogenase family protein [Actinomycetota bacterium]
MATTFFTPEHDELRRAVRRFAEEELAPHAEEWEEAQDYPDWVYARAGELGFLGLTYPQQYGGQDADYFATIVFAEEIGRCNSGGVALGLAVQTDMATPPINRFGTEEQKQRYLAPCISGEKIACLGITEPDAGSDVMNISTTATWDGGSWVINGRKIFITNGYRANFMTLVAKTRRDGADTGHSLFLVDSDTPGFSRTRKLDKVGMRSSDTAEITFEDCRVDADALLGVEGEGFKHIMWELQGERLIGAIAASAGASRMLEAAITYSKQREAFGRPISKFQAMRHKLAEMQTKVTALREFIYYTAYRWNLGEYVVREISMAKLLSGQIGFKVADECLQVFGGFGYSMEFPIQRGWRDTRLNRIGGGTDEVMREVIGKLEGL